MHPGTNGTHKPESPSADYEVGPDGATWTTDRPPPGGPTTKTSSSVPDDPNYLASFRTRLEGLLAAPDYLALGNTVIETLMRPGQDTAPDARSSLLDEFMPVAVRQFCGIPAGLSYPRPFSDEHVEYADRDTWAKDRFIELIIQAFMVGSTIKKLPPPYAHHVFFYRLCAVKQEIAIYETHIAAIGPRPRKNSGRWVDAIKNANRRLSEARHRLHYADHAQFQEQLANNDRERRDSEFLIWRMSREAEDRIRREADERTRAEAGIGDSELARQVREILASGMDDSLIKAEIAFLVKHHKPAAT